MPIHQTKLKNLAPKYDEKNNMDTTSVDPYKSVLKGPLMKEETNYKQWDKNYDEAYRNGAADKSMNRSPLQTALHSRLPGYSQGYYDGYHGLQKGRMNEEYIPEEKIEGFDSEEAHELTIYIQTDSILYNNKTMPVYRFLSKQMKNGKYDSSTAKRIFMKLVDMAALKYSKEFALGNPDEIFSAMDKLEVAEHLEAQFQQKFKEQEYDFMKDEYDFKLKNNLPKNMKKEAGNAAAPYSPSVHFMGRGPGRLVWEGKK